MERPEITWQAAWSDGEVTVVRSVRAGISGPWHSHPADSLDAADAALTAGGYVRLSEWTEHVNGWWATLAQVNPDSGGPGWVGAEPLPSAWVD